MRKVVAAGALSRPHIFSALPHIFLVPLSLGFKPLCPLAPLQDILCIFHSPGLCRGCTLRTVLWSVALEVLDVASVLGWRALVQDLPGSSFGASSPSLPFCCIPATWRRLPSAPFRVLPLLPSSWTGRCGLLPRCGGWVLAVTGPGDLEEGPP